MFFNLSLTLTLLLASELKSMDPNLTAGIIGAAAALGGSIIGGLFAM